jgi:hypothetical protein
MFVVDSKVVRTEFEVAEVAFAGTEIVDILAEIKSKILKESFWVTDLGTTEAEGSERLHSLRGRA